MSESTLAYAGSGGSDNLQGAQNGPQAAQCSPRHPTTAPRPISAHAACTRHAAGEVRHG